MPTIEEDLDMSHNVAIVSFLLGYVVRAALGWLIRGEP